jgi:hypothetical protein
MAQRVGRTEIRYAKDPEEFARLFDDCTLEMLDFVHVSEHLDRCVVRKRPEFSLAPDTNCLPVAIFVTSYARLHLYSYIEQVQQLGHKLLYCDTDSLYYVARNGTARVPEGDSLGQMKREHTGRRIVELIAAGPKNYGFRHVSAENGGDERAELKIRSFRLSYATHQLINFETMRHLARQHFNFDGPL